MASCSTSATPGCGANSVSQGAEHADDGAQLGEGAGRCVLDDGQGLDGTLGVGGRDGTSCLGLDGDARDMVGDGVVEFASELFAFAGLGLVDVADADLRAIADRGAERGGEQEERVPCERLPQAHGVGDVGDGQPEQDDAEAACGFPTGAPPEQGVGQDQRRRHAVQQAPCDPVRILTMSRIVNVPKETATATSGCVRRHSRGPRTAST